MRTAFIETLCALAEQDERIWLLTGDLGYSVLERFVERFPERFVNMGVAEQNMTGVAAGLALCDKIVFTYSIANFPVMRCLEQIRNDVCYHNLNVKIVSVGGGLAYGAAGYTHHAAEDLAVMRAMPNMMVVAPGDRIELQSAMQAIVAQPGPCYLRLGKGGEPVIHPDSLPFQLGKAIQLRKGQDITFITTGTILGQAVQAADRLAKLGLQVGVMSVPTLKPLDQEAILLAAEQCRRLITVEEHSSIGGLGEAVAGILAVAHRMGQTHLVRISLGAPLSVTGTQAYLQKAHGLDADSLVRLALESIQAPLDRTS
jgi:transketolase